MLVAPTVTSPTNRPIMTPLTQNTSSLLRPLTEAAVLIPDEQVYYAERQHWASIVQPVYETFIFLLFVVWVVDWRATGSFSTGLVAYILLAAAIHAAVLALTGGRARFSRLALDPFSNVGGFTTWSPWLRRGLIALAVVIALQLGIRQAAVLAVFIAIARLTLRLARWAFYERRFITNRRLIESSGFLGSKISSMPLSRVTDIVYGRSVPGEIFGYARMRVETAGQDQALGTVQYIAEPDHFYAVLVNFSAPRSATPSTDV